ncbi:hypothetical protein XA68_18133 [Ophiocordyceps unilateralis]|uniref:Monothiol glutaredoxin-5, mitochondrial n=1 Tax=Ophiocordyceps unilateralis TaxID=268505 RepID=A0A2A9PJY2_OPHUN|nr:hypothetical protein XA68_18133 [Ophiocordyceps unilateralis]
MYNYVIPTEIAAPSEITYPTSAFLLDASLFRLPSPLARFTSRTMAARTIASGLLRQAARPAFVRPTLRAAPMIPTTLLQARLLSDATRAAIDKAVASAPVVLFMKGTPELPQCGFSRGVIQILSMQGVDPGKFAAFNVLEDQELREGIKEYSDWPTIPQLYVEKEFIGGADIVNKMYQDGDLGNLCKDKGLLMSQQEQK